MLRSSLNPFKELRVFFIILYNFYLFKPDIVHLITIKAYLYGGIAARLVRVPCVVSSIAGLGSFFHRKNLKNLIQRIISSLFILNLLFSFELFYFF